MKRRGTTTQATTKQPLPDGKPATVAQCQADYRQEQARPKTPRRHFWDDLA